MPRTNRNFGLSRRDFLGASAVAAATTLTGCAVQDRKAPAFMTDANKAQKIRVGLIGCGGRGTGAALDCVKAAPNIEIVALGDLFPDRIESCRKTLMESAADACKVTPEYCFTGFDNYKGVLGSNIDMAILATPPGFRPIHFAAAIDAGKHVFMEKPVAVDPVGARQVIAAADSATQKNLCVVAGTQRRHDPAYVQTMKRVLDGAIGDIVSAQCYWNQGELWVKQHEAGWSDMEWQCRNWLYFGWLSGDHIVEQHVHNIDIVNWAMGGPPAKCIAMGGREVRKAPEYGNIFDHFSVEFEYPNGVRMMSMCRQIKGTSSRVSERLVGTRGVCDPNGTIEGRNPWKYQAPEPAINPYVQEHVDLITAIRSGHPINEGRRIAESTLTAIMGRMSAYTGRELSWNWVMNSSALSLAPSSYAFGDLAVAPVAVPGQTELV